MEWRTFLAVGVALCATSNTFGQNDLPFNTSPPFALKSHRSGAHLTLVNERVSAKSIVEIANGPPTTALGFQDCAMSSDAFRELGRLTQIKLLSFYNTRLTPRDLEHIARLTQLESFSADHADIDREGLAKLVKLPLKDLSLDGANLVDADADCLEPFIDHLEGLSLYDTPVGDQWAAVLTRCKNLKRLAVGSETTDRGAAQLSKLEGLTEIGFEGSSVTDRGVENLSQFESLRKFGAKGSGISDDTARHLARFPNLFDVRLIDARVSSNGLDALAKLPRLDQLDLTGCPTTDADLRSLEPLPGLRLLWLDRTKISDESVELLMRFPKLVQVTTGGTRVTRAAKIQLRDATLPH